MLDKEPISISFVTEKIVGRGEDAPPLLISKGQACAVGVFDGMGGSGAVLCDSIYGEGLSMAYVASRIVASSMETFLHNHLLTDDVTAEDMKAVIDRRLKKEQEDFPLKKTTLRTKIVRNYPTTMALVVLQEHDDSLKVDSYWAGDSHCYLWDKEGLSQINKDDLVSDNDPLENLQNDSPISNCICVGSDFVIHHKSITIEKCPVIILSATDGCFGYFQTPMHFEYILKSCLLKAQNKKEWECLIKNELLKVTGDDCSLSLIAVGFSSFDELKKAVRPLSVTGFTELREQEKTMEWIEKELAKEKEKYEKNKIAGWNRYKTNYMKYLNEGNDTNA